METNCIYCFLWQHQNVATGSMGENGYYYLSARLCSKENWRDPSALNHVIFMKNLRFSSRPRAKVRRQGPPGFARAQPCSGNTNSDLSLPRLSVISELPVSCDHKKIWWTEHGLQMVYWKKIWVRGLGKVCLWLFLLSSTAENTVTLTNVCVTGYMVHRNQLQPCILCS